MSGGIRGFCQGCTPRTRRSRLQLRPPVLCAGSLRSIARLSSAPSPLTHWSCLCLTICPPTTTEDPSSPNTRVRSGCPSPVFKPRLLSPPYPASRVPQWAAAHQHHLSHSLLHLYPPQTLSSTARPTTHRHSTKRRYRINQMHLHTHLNPGSNASLPSLLHQSLPRAVLGGHRWNRNTKTPDAARLRVGVGRGALSERLSTDGPGP